MRKKDVVGRPNLLQQPLRKESSPMTKEKDHESQREEESEKKIRDLPPKEDVKGGNSKEKTRASGRTGEVDFMQDYD